MPFIRKKKTFKRKATKKPFVKKKAFANSLMNVPLNSVNMGLGFPKRCVVKQKYCDNVVLTSTFGVLARQTYRFNSLFDPDFTGTGHQPMYFDNYMSIYAHYTVIGAKIRVKVLPYEDNVVPMAVAIMQNDDSVFTITDISTVAEQSKSNVQLAGSDGSDYKVLNMNYSAKKTFGGSVLGNINLQGTSTSGPSENSFCEIIVQSADYLATTTCVLQVYIEYITVYTELRDLTQQ